MTTTPTQDIAATVAQSIRLAEAGCQIVRITAPTVKDAAALATIRREFSTAGFADIPLVADIHFMPAAAMEAVEHVEKVRVNPGNYADRKQFKEREYTDAEYSAELERIHQRFSPLVLRAKAMGRGDAHWRQSWLLVRPDHEPLRRHAGRYGRIGDGIHHHRRGPWLPESDRLDEVIESKVMVHAYRLLVQRLQAHGEQYPLHLGVTEAGDGEDGRIKGAAGIGRLLADGIGDTIRVSLTEEPEAEIPVAKELGDWADALPTLVPIPAAPAEVVDPYAFRRRVGGEIVRLGGADGLPVGGGGVPAVLAPLRVPADDDAGCLLTLYSTSRYRGPVSSAGSKPPIRCRCRWRCGMGAAGCPPLRSSCSNLAPLIRSPIYSGCWRRCRLRPWLALASHPRGVLRSYRLLAAIDEDLFKQAEAARRGTGVRHALLLADLEQTDYLQAAVGIGGLLIDGIGDAIFLPRVSHPLRQSFAILQAVKARQTRADFVACPSCGRTLFDLIQVTDHIKEATAHLDGVTIAIMGCIVNGPGEMADADFGYVGSGVGVITLYRGREPVRRNIPMADARDQLVELIKEHGMWKDPEDQTRLGLMILLLVAMGCTQADQEVAAATASPAPASQLATLTLAVSKMSCNGCANRIEHHLGQLPGISGCEVTFVEDAPGPAVIQYDPAVVDEAAIIAAIDGLNRFTVTRQEPALVQ